KVYRARGYEVPEFSRTAKGLPLINLLDIEQGEWVNAVISVHEFDPDSFLFFTTKHGLSNRTTLQQFANIRNGGLIAVGLNEKDIAIATKNGYIIRFDENVVRSMGRTAAGVRGIRLREDDEVVSMEIIEENSQILHVTSKGVGKRTDESEYRSTNRGGKGYFA